MKQNFIQFKDSQWLEENPSGAKQAAEKGTESGYSKKKVWQGLKPASLLCCSYGTTEVVPCYKAAFRKAFYEFFRSL